MRRAVVKRFIKGVEKRCEEELQVGTQCGGVFV